MAENTEFPKLDLQSSLLDDDKKPFMIDPYEDDYKSQDELKYTPPKIETPKIENPAVDLDSDILSEELELVKVVKSIKDKQDNKNNFQAPDWSVDIESYEKKDTFQIGPNPYQFKTAQNDNPGDVIGLAKFENGVFVPFPDAQSEIVKIFKSEEGPESGKPKFTYRHLDMLLNNADNSIFQGNIQAWRNWIDKTIKPREGESVYPGLYASIEGLDAPKQTNFSNIEQFYYAMGAGALPNQSDAFWDKPIPEEIAKMLGDVVPPSWLYEQNENWEVRANLEARGIRAYNFTQDRPANTTYAEYGDQKSYTDYRKLDEKLFGDWHRKRNNLKELVVIAKGAHTPLCDPKNLSNQLTESLVQIAEKGRGVVFYLQQEGRGIGLSNKIRAYNLQDKGFDTVEANHQLGFKEDEREYENISGMINFLGIKKIDLMTNNPKKINALKNMGIVVNQRVALTSDTNKYNEKYISTKVKKLGHLF